MQEFAQEIRVIIEKRLGQTARRVLDYPVKGTAAVLMPIVLHPEGPTFLLTKRTESVGTHKGQISFPGGLREQQDESLLATALRETQEELGLSPSVFDVVGRFHDYLAVTEWLVAPFVGLMKKGARINPNPSEVEKTLEIPLEFFSSTPPRVERRRRLGRVIPIYFYDYGQEIVWGLTAAIIRDFVSLLREP